ncbi:MAG TPA: phage/plasmid primase, P4 family [Pseudonocardiaceae bacterium]|nr:phage/plasmid primase, P4 family [Pseudonocardiaceae bacterium]
MIPYGKDYPDTDAWEDRGGTVWSGADPLPKEPLTELGHARRLVKAAGHRLRWVPAWRRWLVWDGRRWALDATGAADRAVKQVARAVTRRCADLPEDDPNRKTWLRSALKLEAASAVRGTLALAGTEPDIAVAPDQLDADPHLLNVSNGVLDLNTGDIGPHDPDLLLTRITAAAYHPSATAPTWETFLARVLPDQATRDFVCRLLGSSLPGTVTEHVLPIFLGAGANGKSTMLGAVASVLGEYAATADPALLVDRGYDSHPTGVADLHGRRLALVHETDSGRSLAEGTVKRLTGGDVIKARRMREDFWEFSPSHLLIMVTNHRPKVRGTDEGIWRRLRLVPFDVVVPPEERDSSLPDKLAAEADGILRWLVQGHRQWCSQGLGEPDTVTTATAAYRDDEDALGRFLTEKTCRSQGAVRTSQLYAEWQRWAAAEGLEPGTQTAFSRDLGNRGYEIGKSAGNSVVRGLGLTTDREES